MKTYWPTNVSVTYAIIQKWFWWYGPIFTFFKRHVRHKIWFILLIVIAICQIAFIKPSEKNYCRCAFVNYSNIISEKWSRIVKKIRPVYRIQVLVVHWFVFQTVHDGFGSEKGGKYFELRVERYKTVMLFNGILI